MNRRSFFEMLGVASVALGLSKSASAQSGSNAEARLKELGLASPGDLWTSVFVERSGFRSLEAFFLQNKAERTRFGPTDGTW